MSKNRGQELSDEEQHVLDHGHIEVLSRPEDIARCDQAILDHHYLHDATLVGEHLRYAFVYKGRWLAVATWSAAAFHIKDRDQFIGWSGEQCRRRRALLANNSRLLVMPDCHWPNLISRFMKLMLGRLSQDWEQQWAHPIAMVETFVDPRFYQGTAYKVSGWSHLGKTAGWKRDAADFYEKNDAPKQIWVRELVKKACVKLRAPQLPAAWAQVEEAVAVRCDTKVEKIRSLMEALQEEVREFRRAQALAYPVDGLICLMVMANAHGVVGGPHDLARYAATLSQGQLRALKFRYDRHTREIRCPKKTTFNRLLNALDGDALERLLLRWQDQILGPRQDRLVIVDGKKIRHAGVEIVNATDSQGRFLGSALTPNKTNEIPVARQLLRGLNLLGKITLADAIHTQDESGQQILFEGGGDYLLTVKGNQPTIHKNLETLFAKQSFSPSTHSQDPGPETGAQLPTLGNSLSGVPGSDAEPSRLSRCSAGRSIGDTGQAQRQMVPGNRLPGQQPDSGGAPSRGDAHAQANLLGDRKQAAPLPGHHPARRSEPGQDSRTGTDSGDDSTRGGQLGQRGGQSSAKEKSQDQVQHRHLSRFLPRSPRWP